MSEQTSPPAAPRGRRKPELDPRLAAYKGVWVFVEHERGVTHPVSWELLGEGRKLANKLGVDLAAVVCGAPGVAVHHACNEAFCYGADLRYLIEDPILAGYRNEAYTKALTDLVNQYQPEIVLLGATTLGRDLAGSIATTLATGLTADCTELNIDMENRSLATTRPTFGGSLLCTIVTLNYRPQMATVRPRVMHMPERDTSRTGRIIKHSLSLIESNIVTKVLEFIPDEQQEQAQLAYADIIVFGGRGLKRLENFQLVWDLAKVLGAEVGATRPLIQAGSFCRATASFRPAQARRHERLAERTASADWQRHVAARRIRRFLPQHGGHALVMSAGEIVCNDAAPLRQRRRAPHAVFQLAHVAREAARREHFDGTMMATNGSLRRGDSSCKALANISLPVPDSPRNNTVEWLRATRRTLSSTDRIAGVVPMIPVGVGTLRSGCAACSMVFSSLRCSSMSHSRSRTIRRCKRTVWPRRLATMLRKRTSSSS